MAEKNDFPIEYRRYLAGQGIDIHSSNEADESAAAVNHASAQKPPPDTEPVKTPTQILKDLEYKVRDKPDDPGILNQYIKIAYEMGELEAAVTIVKRYVDRHPRDNGMRQNYAMLLVRTGKPSRAKVELRKILSYNPKFKPARETLERLRKEEEV